MIARFEVKITYKNVFVKFFFVLNEYLNYTEHQQIIASFWVVQQSEQYDLLLLEACACYTFPLFAPRRLLL